VRFEVVNTGVCLDVKPSRLIGIKVSGEFISSIIRVEILLSGVFMASYARRE
jgi:hypothetical protein